MLSRHEITTNDNMEVVVQEVFYKNIGYNRTKDKNCLDTLFLRLRQSSSLFTF